MRFIRILVFGIMGLMIGLGVENVLSSGYSEKWHELPPPPSAISELLVVFNGTLFVRTVDGSLLQCSNIRNECWTQGQIPENYRDWVRITMPCDFSSSEFSFLTNPPKNIGACIQGVEQFGEGTGRETYLLDKAGNVWEWNYTFAGYNPIYATIAPYCCPFSGVALGFVWLLIKAKKNRVS
jgi:hypothetical protein